MLCRYISQLLAWPPAVTQLRFLPEKRWHTHWIDIVSKYAEGTHMHQWSYGSCRLRKAILYYTYESKVGIFEYAWSIDIFEIRDRIWALECKRRSRGVTKGNIMGRSLRSCLRWHCWSVEWSLCLFSDRSSVTTWSVSVTDPRTVSLSQHKVHLNWQLAVSQCMNGSCVTDGYLYLHH